MNVYVSFHAKNTEHGPLKGRSFIPSVSGEGLAIPKWISGHYPQRCLPTLPLWSGFAVNTVFYAGVLWVLCCGPFALRRMIRRRRGQCAQCSYPIGQNERCTECGAAVTPQASRDQGIEASRE